MDIKVEDIVKKFQGVERPEIYSSLDRDDFLTILNEKQYWTLEEYKIVYYAYANEYMHRRAMDSVHFYRIRQDNNFTTEWNDYFYILDNIKDEDKQAQYADYYFWYHGNQLTEEVFLEFVKKPYYSKVSKDSRVKFLSHNVKTDNSTQWVDNYFSADDIKSWLHSNSVSFHININDDNYNIDNNKIEQVKKFYNNYEKYMNYQAQLKFFNEAIQRGSLELIEFLYVEKSIRLKAKDKMKMFWHLCADTSVGNVMETLSALREYGMKFSPYDLSKTKSHSQWGYMEHSEKLEHFFDMLQKEEDYKVLIKKLNSKSSSPAIKETKSKI